METGRRKPPSLAVFDLDGTLTLPGQDLWSLHAHKHCVPAEAFKKIFSQWKEQGKKTLLSSRTMMEYALQHYPKNWGKAEFMATAKNIITERLDCDSQMLLRPAAIALLNEHLSLGGRNGDRRVAVSTTNYQFVAHIFITELIARKIIAVQEGESIACYGSTFDFTTRTLQHFNYGPGKLASLSADERNLPLRLDYAYGDEPEGTDCELLTAARQSYSF